MAKRNKKARNARYKASAYVGVEIGASKLQINSNLNDEQIMERLFQLTTHPCNKANHPEGNCIMHTQCIRGFADSKRLFSLQDPLKSLGRNPSELLRKESVKFVGLENLGATCYMNSLLQCLFMNSNFRNSLYMWKNDDNMNFINNSNEDAGNEREDLNDNVCFQLQLLFATLQYSLLSSYSPQTLISLLNIKASIQQDAQEFNKLFITYLEERFAKSENHKLQTFIKDEFQGKCSYNTICKICNQVSRREEVFYELELNIQNNNNLEKCLNAYIKEEELTGDNKYDCDNCKGLVDAKRKMNLVSLPPVLNFQLLRYTYDMNTFKKVKIQNNIEFPKTLVMNPFMEENNQSGNNNPEQQNNEEYVYELTAILMHLGGSAYGGHYIAQIRDEETGTWWRFNDDKVDRISDNEVGEFDSIYDEEPKFQQQGRRNRNNNNNNNKVNEPIKPKDRLSSKNAYMLIYARKNRYHIPPTPIPSTIENFVKSQNTSLLQLIEDYETQKAKLTEEITYEKEFFEKVFLEINVNHNQKEEFHWIDSVWFQRFAKGEKNLDRINNECLLCTHHQKVDPRNITRMKQISVISATLLYERFGGGPILTKDDCCYQCAIAYYDEMVVENELKETQKKMFDLANIHSRKANHIKLHTPKDYYYISKPWFLNWQKFVRGDQHQPLDDSLTKDIMCEHKQLTHTDNKVMIPTEVWNFLKEKYGASAVEFPCTTRICETCIKEAQQYKKLIASRTEERIVEKKYLESLADKPVAKRSLPSLGTYCLIPYLWHSEWKSYISDPHIAEKPEKIDNSVFLCEHGKLIINPIVFNNSNNQNSYVVIREEDWNKLLPMYDGDPKISFTISLTKNNKPAIALFPEICEGCKAKKDEADFALRLNYKQQTIWFTTAGFGQTRSIPKKIPIKVDSGDSITIVKMKLMEIVHLTPVEQQISYNDMVLADCNQTLADYGILPNYTLELHKVETEEDASKKEEAFEQSIFHSSSSSSIPKSSDQLSVESINEISNTNNGEKLNDDNNEKEEQKENVEEDSSNKWICERCTLMNSNSSPNCEICGTARPTGKNSNSGWTCQSCTLINPFSAKTCDACHKKR